MQKDHIVARIQAALSDARVELEDLTGTADHWKARIVSSAFAGKTLIERHRMVYATLGERMGGEIPFVKSCAVRIGIHAAATIEKVHLLRNSELIETIPGSGLDMHLEREVKLDTPGFLHCRVTQRDGHLAVCSPVWVG